MVFWTLIIAVAQVLLSLMQGCAETELGPATGTVRALFFRNRKRNRNRRNPQKPKPEPCPLSTTEKNLIPEEPPEHRNRSNRPVHKPQPNRTGPIPPCSFKNQNPRQADNLPDPGENF